MIENSQFITKVSTKNYKFTAHLYSSGRNMKCNSLNYNINKTLLKENICLNCYKWTDENNININVYYYKKRRAGERAQQWKTLASLPHNCGQFLAYTWEPTTTHYFKIRSSEAIF